MSAIVLFIATFFLIRWLDRLGGSRDIDNVLPWMRIGHWPAHKVLPALVFLPYVAWMEGWIFSTSSWPNFGTPAPTSPLLIQ